MVYHPKLGSKTVTDLKEQEMLGKLRSNSADLEPSTLNVAEASKKKSRMQRRSLAFFLSFTGTCIPSFAQGYHYQQIAINQYGTPDAVANIAVCARTLTAIACSSTSTIYSDEALTTAKAISFASSDLPSGNYDFYGPPTDHAINITGTRLAGISSYPTLLCTRSATVSGCVESESDRSASGSVEYVSSRGSDSNDGLTWGTAKLTVYAALEALPGGATSPPTAGSGVVEIAGTVSYGGPASNGGLWLFGSGDPNFSAGLSGWLGYTGQTSKSLTIDCAAPNGTPDDGHISVCNEYWGAHTDNVHPGFWLSAISSVNIRGIAFNGSQTNKIAIDSNNSRTDAAGTDGITLENFAVTSLQCSVGTASGPALDIGTNSFWIYMRNGNFSGCRFERWTVSTLARSSNVVTVTTSATNDVAVGQIMTIQNAADPSFNGSYTVTGVSGSPQTVFTFSQNGPNASSSGGQTFGATSAGMAINPGSGAGAGLIFMYDTIAVNGSIWLSTGTSGTGLFLDGLSYEGNGSTPDTPAVEITGVAVPGSNIHVANVEMSDTIVNVPAVEVDNAPPGTQDFVYVEHVQGGGVSTPIGPMNCIGCIYSSGTVISPLRFGQSGIADNRLIGATDAGRRIFAPAAVRTANIADTNPADWTAYQGTLTITTGITAPDGTTNAGQASTTSTLGELGFYIAPNTPLTIGDYYIYGVWARSETANGLHQPVISFGLNGSGYGSGDYCSAGPNGGPPMQSGTLINTQYITGDGQWDWYSGVCKIISDPANAGLAFIAYQVPTQTGQYYAPVLLHFAAGSISDNEAYEIGNNLASYGTNCPTGSVCQLPTQTFSFAGTTQFFGTLAHSNTANRTYAMPDSNGSIPYFSGTPMPGHVVTWGRGGLLQDGGTAVSGNASGSSRSINQPALGTGSQGIGAPSPRFTNLTRSCAGTQTWAIDSASVANASITLTGACKLSLTGLLTGGNYILKVIQGGSGNNTLTLDSGCTWKISGGGRGAVNPTPAPGAIDILAFTYDGTNCYANYDKNFN